MVVHDLDTKRIAFTPTEDNPPLIVDSNAPLVFATAF